MAKALTDMTYSKEKGELRLEQNETIEKKENTFPEVDKNLKSQYSNNDSIYFAKNECNLEHEQTVNLETNKMVT